MRLKSFLLVVAVMLLALTETLSAQTGRTLGARKFQLDDGTNTATGLVFLQDVGGSLGIDVNGAPGLVNGATFPSPCALLDLSSTTKGFLTPRMTNAQELGICSGTPPEGLIVYNLTNHTLDVFNGSAWGPVSGWQLRGNSITLGSTAIGGSYIGTNTAQDFVTATAGVERTRVVGIAGATQGFMGIGTNSPNRLLEVAGASGTPSARFGSLGAVPLLAPPLVATDGIVMANNAGDINKYNTAFVVGTVAWLRTGNTIADGNNILGTLNDIAINIQQNGATVMTVGNVAQGSDIGIKTAPTANWALTVGTVAAGPNNSTLNLGNERVNGTFNSQGNSTVGTNPGTTNSFGDIGASTNTIGNGAGANNQMGNGGGATFNFIGQSATQNSVGVLATTNFFGQQAGTNNIGVLATTNNIGAFGTSTNDEEGSTNTMNASVQNIITGATNINISNGLTTQIASTSAATTNIGVLNGTNRIAGTTTINNNVNNNTSITTGTSTGNTTIGNSLAGPISLQAFNTPGGVGSSAITLDVTNINRNLTLNNIAPGTSADAAFLDMTTIASGNVRTRTIQSMVTGSEGVQVEYPANSIADAHLAKDNASVLFASTRFINTNNQILNITSGNPGANTVLQVNGGTNAVNVNTGNYGLTTIGNGAGANTQLTVNGAVGGLVGVAPFSNGPNNGWDMYVNGDQQVTGTVKIGTASIVEEGVGNTITGFNPVGLTLNTGNSGGFGDLKFQGAGVLAATVKGTGALVGSIDLPQTVAAGPGIITMGGTRYIHAFGGANNNFFAGQLAGNFTNSSVQTTGVGAFALASLTTGNENTAFGYAALTSTTTGNQNVALGRSALSNNSTGGQNTAVGYAALNTNSSATDNTGIGFDALLSNNTGARNSAVGSNAMISNNSGTDNTAIGFAAMSNTVSGSFNVAAGRGALNNTNANNNVGIGFLAGQTNTTGTSNTFIGDASNANAGNYTFATALGAGSTVGQSSSVVLGRVGDNIGIGIIAPTTNLDVRGTTTVVGTTNINSNNASLAATNIGSTTNTSAVTIASNSNAASGSIVLDVTNIATGNLRLNNIQVGAATDAAFLDMTTVNSGNVRTRTIQSMVTGSNGVSVEYPNTSVADAHFADAANKSVFTTNRFINIDNQNLSFTGGGANTTFINLNGTNNGVDINNTTVGNNNIGNGGGTTSNAIGTNATFNNFGQSASQNNFGVNNAATNTNNFYGEADAAGSVVNAIGRRFGAGTATNNIGDVGATTNNIGTTTSTNTVLGATNINVTGGQTTQIATTNAATTSIGVLGGTNNIKGLTRINDGTSNNTMINTNAGTGSVQIGSSTNTGGILIQSNANPTAITLDVTGVANNLVMNNIANDATPLSMLSLNATNQVRTTALSLMALEGVVYSGGAFRLGSTLTAGAGSNPFLGAGTRNVNIDAGTLAFTSNNGALTPLQIIGGAAPQVNIQAVHNVNTGAYALTKIGNGSSNHQLEVNGVVDALVGDALASPRWDLAVTGDIAASGIIKSGASIIIDGVNAGNRRIISDLAMTVSTLAGDLVFAPASANTAVTGHLSVSDFIIATNAITSTAGNIVASAGSVTANNNITATLGDIAASAGSISAAQNITSTGGNVSATNGKVVAGGVVAVPSSTLHSYGSLGANTAAGGSTTLTVTNFFYRCTVPGSFVTLAAAASCSGRIYIVKNDGSFGGAQITTVNSGGGQIDGAASINLTGPNTVMQFISDGTNWYVISNN